MTRILIVEDDAVLRASLAASLADEYIVHSEACGNAAVQFLRHQAVDVVLLDILMDDGDGFFVLSRMPGLAPAARVLVVTGVADVAKATKAMQLGAHNYLVKPVSLYAVKESLRQLVAMNAHESTCTGRRGLLAVACR